MKKNKRGLGNNRKWNFRCCCFLLPGLCGILLFFIIPYIRILYYSVINNQFDRKFAGLDNYLRILSNDFFRLAVKNSILLILIAVPLLIVLALFISFFLTFSRKKAGLLEDAFIFPMLVPTAAVALIWRALFGTVDSALPIYLLFIWKNLGLCLIFLGSALTTIDPTVYEAAKLEGARWYSIHLHITIPMITPVIFFTVLLGMMNTFRIFKESYLYYGSKYPPEYSYTLQYYMNNNFLKFDYQTLAASAVLTSILVVAIIAVGFSIQRRFEI